MKKQIKSLAIIPARGGSKGVPNKNLLEVGATPLVARAILACKSAELLDGVYVSSDAPEILKVASSFDAEIIKRPKKLSSDISSSESVVLHFLDHLSKNNILCDIVVMVQCTSPFINPNDINKLIASCSNSDCDSALLATKFDHFIWDADENGFGRGTNFNHKEQRKRRQDLDPQFLEAGSVYAFKKSSFILEQNRFCGRTKIIETGSNPIQVDTQFDLLYANFVENNKPEKILRSGSLPTKLSIKALVMDFDGVLTNNLVLVNEMGSESVICSRDDGFALEKIKLLGISTLILSREVNEVVKQRAKKLKCDVINGENNKLKALQKWCADNQILPNNLAFIGNDLPDLESLQYAKFSFCPSDANQIAKNAAKYILRKKGGEGCIREILENYITS